MKRILTLAILVLFTASFSARAIGEVGNAVELFEAVTGISDGETQDLLTALEP